MQVELVDQAGSVVASANRGQLVQIPASDKPLTACVELDDELVLVELLPGPRRWGAFGCTETTQLQ